MRVVVWEDEDGYLHRSLLRDDDPDHLAPKGVPLDPPDLNRLDWDGLVRDLHNLLVSKELASWEDVMHSQNGVTASIISVFKRPIIGLHRQTTTED